MMQDKTNPNISVHVMDAFGELFFIRALRNESIALCKQIIEERCSGKGDGAPLREATRMLSDAIRSESGVVFLLEAIASHCSDED